MLVKLARGGVTLQRAIKINIICILIKADYNVNKNYNELCIIREASIIIGALYSIARGDVVIRECVLNGSMDKQMEYSGTYEQIHIKYYSGTYEQIHIKYYSGTYEQIRNIIH